MMASVPERVSTAYFPRFHFAAQLLHAIERGNDCAG
jgi:hypothetical protein